MAWFKIKYGSEYRYSLCADNYRHVIHRCADLSLEDVNDPNRDFELYRHSYFIQESVKEKKTKQVKLPNGVYTVLNANDDTRCKLIPMSTANNLKLLDFEFNAPIIKDFKTFIKSKAIYNEFPNKIYKKGILLFGPPGTGKTQTIQKILSEAAPKESLALFVNTPPCLELLKNLAEDSRLKIIIFEELFGILSEDDLPEMLTFLDGETSLENCYIIASTNYPEKLPANLTNRPGRFDLLYEIGTLSEKDRRAFFNKYYQDVSDAELSSTEKMTIVQLTEVILLIKRDSLTFEDAVAKLKAHEELSRTKFVKRKKDKDLFKDIL